MFRSIDRVVEYGLASAILDVTHAVASAGGGAAQVLHLRLQTKNPELGLLEVVVEPPYLGFHTALDLSENVAGSDLNLRSPVCRLNLTNLTMAS